MCFTFFKDEKSFKSIKTINNIQIKYRIALVTAC